MRGASSTHDGILRSCTSLTKLALVSPTLLDSSATGPAPSAPTATLLDLQLLLTHPAGPTDSSCWEALEASVLPHLTALTRLDVALLAPKPSGFSNMARHVSRFAKLQQLFMGVTGALGAEHKPYRQIVSAVDSFTWPGRAGGLATG